MPFELFIDLPTNKQILPVVIGIAIVVVVGLIIAINILTLRDKHKRKVQENTGMKLKREKMMDQVSSSAALDSKMYVSNSFSRTSCCLCSSLLISCAILISRALFNVNVCSISTII